MGAFVKNINMLTKKIKGNIDFFISQDKEEFEGEILEWNEIFIHGDPEGLRSLAKILIDLAEINQDLIDESLLPTGEREHITLLSGIDISNSSDNVTIGRLDAKKTGEFYDRYIPLNKDN